MKHPVIYLVRHGETDWNNVGRLQGQQDIALNETGRRQARQAGEKLRALVPNHAELDFVASPMHRTRETMELMRGAIPLPPDGYRMDARLKELSFGRWEGLTWKEVRQADPAGAAARERDKWGLVPPGGESYAMLAERIAPWLAEVERDMVAVAHGGVARALLHLICGTPIRQAPTIDIWQGKILVLQRGEPARWV